MLYLYVFIPSIFTYMNTYSVQIQNLSHKQIKITWVIEKAVAIFK